MQILQGVKLAVMHLHKLVKRQGNNYRGKPVDKAINMTQTSPQLVRIEAAPCVQVNSKLLPFLLDSGSDTHIMSYTSFSDMKNASHLVARLR